MYTFKLEGRIYPEGLILFACVHDIKLVHLRFNIEGEASVTINDSDVSIEYRTSRLYSEVDTGEIETLKNYIEDEVRVVVDTICFSKSYSYDVSILDFTDDSGLLYKFSPRGEFNLNKDDKTITDESLRILSKMYSSNANTYLALALADFRMGIKYPKMTASFCYRAIETIRKFFFEDFTIEDNDKRREDGWGKMNMKLTLTRDDYKHIEKFATPNRHGDYPSITYKERENIMNFTRLIIEKLISTI